MNCKSKWVHYCTNTFHSLGGNKRSLHSNLIEGISADLISCISVCKIRYSLIGAHMYASLMCMYQFLALLQANSSPSHWKDTKTHRKITQTNKQTTHPYHQLESILLRVVVNHNTPTGTDLSCPRASNRNLTTNVQLCTLTVSHYWFTVHYWLWPLAA